MQNPSDPNGFVRRNPDRLKGYKNRGILGAHTA